MLTRVIYTRRGPKLKASGTTTTITSSDTFVAGAAGVYRVLVLPSGGTGIYDDGTVSWRGSGGGSGLPVYGELELTASQNVAVVVGAGRTPPTTVAYHNGNIGNPSSFGDLVAPGNGAALGTAADQDMGGNGWAGGAYGVGATKTGGTLGNDGGAAGAADGKGAGTDLLVFLQSKFQGVTLTSGAAGPAPSSGTGGGGGAGLLIDSAGPSGTAGAADRGGRGEGYGGASGGAVSGTALETSNPGVVIVEGPYST